MHTINEKDILVAHALGYPIKNGRRKEKEERREGARFLTFLQI